MKGLILAAGRGSRLLPISATRPKHAVPVAGIPIIARAVGALRSAGITEIGIVTSPGSEPDLRDATQHSGPLTFIRQTEALGTGHAVLAARAYLEGEQTLLYLGDNLFQDSLRPMQQALAATDAAIGVKRVPNPQAYGVAVVQNGQLVRLVEKPRQPESNLAACGIFAFRPCVLELVADLPPSIRGEIEFPQALTRLLELGGGVQAVEFPGFWSDAGAPADLLAANAHFLAEQRPRTEGRVMSSTVTGNVVIEVGATVQDSELIGPVWIGSHASIRGSVIGPNVSLGAHTRIQGATIRESLIDEFTRVLHPAQPLSHAVIGRHATVTGPIAASAADTSAADTEPQLIIGDRSVIRT